MARVVPLLAPKSEGWYARSSSVTVTMNEVIQPYRSITRRAPKSTSKKLIHVAQPCRIRWDIIIMLLALYNCVLIPYRLSFELPTDSESVLDVIDVVIDLLFIVDIYLNFQTSYIDPRTGVEITELKQIALNYIRNGRFFIDVVACTPVDLIELSVSDASSIALIKMLKLTRILRLSKIIYYMRINQDLKSTLRLGKLLLFILIYLHLLACSWNMLVMVKQQWVHPAMTINEDTHRYYTETETFQYSQCIYVAVSMLIGLELLPFDNATYVFCMVFVIVGALLFTYMLGEIATLLFAIRQSIITFFKQMDSISGTMKTLKLNEALQLDILEYFKGTYHYLLRNEEWERFRAVVPPSFIEEINNYLYNKVVKSHHVFADLSDQMHILVTKLDYKFVRPGDYLIRMNDESEEFYFIVKGSFVVTVEGLDQLDDQVCTLGTGDYCGELGLIYSTLRTATVRASDYSTVGALVKQDFQDLLNDKVVKGFRKHISEYDDRYRVEVTV